MNIDDFKKIYENLKVASDVVDQHEGTFRSLKTAGDLEGIIKNTTGEEVRLREDSPKTRQAEVATNFYVKYQKEIVDYTKSNLNEILNNSDEDKLIRAASLGLKHDPENIKNLELAHYLYSYMLIEHLKEDEEGIQEEKEDSGKKRKKRLSGDMRSKLVQGVLPLIVRERIRGKVPEKDLDFYARNIAYVAALSDRDYVVNAMSTEGQELLGKRIKAIGGINDYIKSNLKEDEDYFSFARSLGEAYTLTSPVNP